MDKDTERLNLMKEVHELDAKIKSFNLTKNLTDKALKLERIDLLHNYNDMKDNSQRILGALAELECVSVGVLYKKMSLNFDE